MAIDRGAHIRLAPPTPSPGVKVSEWREFDALGLSLPHRSLASRWKRSKPIFKIGALTLTLGLTWLVYRFLGLYLFLFVPVLFPGRLFDNRWSKTLERSGVGEGAQVGDFVTVSYQIDGFEYGRDIGTLCFEEDWLLFEGERSTFSIGKFDADAAFQTSLTLHDTVVLALVHTGRRVTIHLDALWIPTLTLWNSYGVWCGTKGPSTGTALLPPLELNPSNDFRPAGQVPGTVFTAFSAWTIAVLFAVLVNLSPVFNLALTSCAAVLGAAGHRVFVNRQRRNAFDSLPKLRASVSAAGGSTAET